MLLSTIGLLKMLAVAGSDACSSLLFRVVEMPAGAGMPLLVGAVAVVTFLAMVLLTMRTLGASSSAMPPPSWGEELLVIMLSVMLMALAPGISSRMPPP